MRKAKAKEPKAKPLDEYEHALKAIDLIEQFPGLDATGMLRVLDATPGMDNDKLCRILGKFVEEGRITMQDIEHAMRDFKRASPQETNTNRQALLETGELLRRWQLVEDVKEHMAAHMTDGDIAEMKRKGIVIDADNVVDIIEHLVEGTEMVLDDATVHGFYRRKLDEYRKDLAEMTEDALAATAEDFAMAEALAESVNRQTG